MKHCAKMKKEESSFTFGKRLEYSPHYPPFIRKGKFELSAAVQEERFQRHKKASRNMIQTELRRRKHEAPRGLNKLGANWQVVV